nr:PREDICTED: uncharacterized protein LOC105662085 [Megachile rotundata]
MVTSDLNSRCQVDLIELQSNRDGEYKFIMVYQDHLTKFVQLQPLKTKRAEEVALPRTLHTTKEYAKVLMKPCLALKQKEPSEQIANIEIEEQLEEIDNTFETEGQLEETVNTSEKNLSSGYIENHIPKKNIEEDLQSITSSHQVLTKKHELISIKRAAAKENLLLHATKILRTSQKQFPPAQIGDTVRIQVPNVDRSRTDSRNVLAVVVGMEDSDFYKLANKNGTLKQLYTRNQFVICTEKLLFIDEISLQEMLLREAAVGNSRSEGQGYTHYHCKRKCSTKKFSCKSKVLVQFKVS